MPLWRRKSLHERLAEEGGVVFGPETPAHDTYPRWGEAGIHGLHRPREWDALVGAEAPGIAGERARFVALPDGTLVVDEEVPDGALVPLAEAVEATIGPPYRAEGVRRGERAWSVGARRITVAAYPEQEADELELVEEGQVVLGRRLDGDLFEIEVTQL